MVGIPVSFWDGVFLGAMLVSGRVGKNVIQIPFPTHNESVGDTRAVRLQPLQNWARQLERTPRPFPVLKINPEVWVV